MMKKLTYQEAYEKIIQAYFKDEMKPADPAFCFCGTLSPDMFWKRQHRIGVSYQYSIKEYSEMEDALLTEIAGCEYYNSGDGFEFVKTPDYEEKLFNGMCASLDVLKQIHIERGENVDEVPVFEKRILKKA